MANSDRYLFIYIRATRRFSSFFLSLFLSFQQRFHSAWPQLLQFTGKPTKRVSRVKKPWERPSRPRLNRDPCHQAVPKPIEYKVCSWRWFFLWSFQLVWLVCVASWNEVILWLLFSQWDILSDDVPFRNKHKCFGQSFCLFICAIYESRLQVHHNPIFLNFFSPNGQEYFVSSH